MSRDVFFTANQITWPVLSQQRQHAVSAILYLDVGMIRACVIPTAGEIS